MTDMITRCPSCDTSFRITQAQLQTAKGAVRCGACLHIFKAADHLVVDENKASKKTETKVTPSTTKQPAQSSNKPSTNKTYKESPKFEYHKPDVPSPLIALVGDEPSEAGAKPIVPPSIKPQTPSHSAAPTTQPDNTDVIDFEAEEKSTEKLRATTPIQPVHKSPEKKTVQQPPEVLEFDQHAIDSEEITAVALPEDDILISDDLPLEGEEDTERQSGAYGDDLVESFLDLDTWKPKETSLFDRDSKSKKSKFDDEDSDSQDESWAIDLLSRDEDEEQEKDESFKFIKPEERQTPSRQEQEEQFFADENEYGKNDFIADEYSQSSTGSFETIDDDFDDISADNLGESISDNSPQQDSLSSSNNEKKSNNDGGFDLEAHNASEKTKKSSPDNDDIDEDYTENFSDSFEPRDNFEENDFNQDEDEYGDSDYDTDFDGSYSEQPDRKSILKGITPAPVEFHYKGNNSSWIRRSLWAIAIIVGIVGLIGQIAWQKFDTLSRKQPYRDIFITACPILGCKVPNIAVPGMIKTTNFLVREHPTEQNALMVDTILLNTATFEQPFPNLVITFTDIKGNTVASRSFSPKEYLGGELAGKTNIPSNQPVHLALEIVNPGPEAVNYTAHIPQ
ncbi:MAG: zinc-ribbon domain-containing protein [Cellvibrionaceae bacterium]